MSMAEFHIVHRQIMSHLLHVDDDFTESLREPHGDISNPYG
jgi:hypothetical protein